MPHSGEYIATNTTVAGRAQNRRVDVVFANHAEVRTPVAQNEPSPEQGTEESRRRAMRRVKSNHRACSVGWCELRMPTILEEVEPSPKWMLES